MFVSAPRPLQPRLVRKLLDGGLRRIPDTASDRIARARAPPIAQPLVVSGGIVYAPKRFEALDNENESGIPLPEMPARKARWRLAIHDAHRCVVV